MRHPVPTPRAFRSQRLIVLTLLLGVAACDVPAFEGPQIQSPPPAFFIQNEAYQNRRMFRDHEIVSHDAWVETSWGFFSGIYINGHRGVLTEGDVRAAQEAALAAAVSGVIIENVEPLTIDGRDAWGWAERLQTRELGLSWIRYRAMVPYDTISYAIDFHGGEPELKGRPDTLRVIVASFAIGQTTRDLPLLAILGGMTLFLVAALQRRSQARATRLQGIRFVKIKKDNEKESDEGPESEVNANADAESGSAPSD